MKFLLVIAGVLSGTNGLALAFPPEHRSVGELPIGMTAVEDARLRIEDEFDAPVQAGLRAHLDDAAADNEAVSAMGRAFGFGVDAVYCVHTMGMVKGPTTSRCVTAAGEAVELDAAWSDFVARRYAAHGSMTQPMVEAIDAGAADAWHDATVWLRQPAPEPREFLPRDAETFAMLDRRRVARQVAIADACRALEGCRVSEQAKLRGPFIYVSATRAGLEELAFHPIVGVVEPTRDIEEVPATGNQYLHASNFGWIQGLAPPWRGTGTKVAIVEGPRIQAAALPAFAGIHNQDPSVDLYCAASNQGTHATAVGSVVAADSSFGASATRLLDGSAPGTHLLVANLGAGGSRNCVSSMEDATCDPTCGFSASLVGAVNWARQKQVDVINYSNGGVDASIPYLTRDRFFDYVGNTFPWPTIVPVTGQVPNETVSSSACSNCIVVGGSDDNNTSSRVDDSIYADEDHANRIPGLEVPHVVAPAVSVRILTDASWQPGWGTSLAAPQVSGLAASIIGSNTSLSGYPEAVRALIMATATNDVDGQSLDLSDAVDDRDGAGAINARLAADLMLSSNQNVWNTPNEHGLNFGPLDSSDFHSNSYYNNFVMVTAPAGWRHLQATLTWNVVSTCSDIVANCPAMMEPEAIGNYAIEVHEGFGNIVAQSTTPSLSHNYVHVRVESVVPGQTYLIFIKRIWENPNPPAFQYFGLAWHLFNPFFE